MVLVDIIVVLSVVDSVIFFVVIVSELILYNRARRSGNQGGSEKNFEVFHEVGSRRPMPASYL